MKKYLLCNIAGGGKLFPGLGGINTTPQKHAKKVSGHHMVVPQDHRIITMWLFMPIFTLRLDRSNK